MNVEDFFSSRLRMKILKTLFQVGEFNGSEIARKLGVNYVTARKNLNLLEAEGVLTHITYGRIRLYRLNEQSPKTKAIETLIEAWEQANKP